MLPFEEGGVCQHTTRIVYLDGHGYNAEGHIIDNAAYGPDRGVHRGTTTLGGR